MFSMQAGVAIGLALIVKHGFSTLSVKGAEIGSSVITSIMATCIFFEITVPALTNFALKKVGEIPQEDRAIIITIC